MQTELKASDLFLWVRLVGSWSGQAECGKLSRGIPGVNIAGKDNDKVEADFLEGLLFAFPPL